MSVLRVGFDMDGVLADFNTPYIALIEKYTGIKLPPVSDTYPNCWNYERAAGVEKSRENAMWKEIKESRDFWLSLPILPDAAFQMQRYDMELLYKDVDTYFITNRSGHAVQQQTTEWLEKNIWLDSPAVLVAREKGAACKLLDLTHYIDDKVENVESVLTDSPKTKVFLLDRPWNRNVVHLPRVTDLGIFIDILMLDYQKYEPTHMETY